MTLLEVRQLSRHYRTRRGWRAGPVVEAVREVGFDLAEGQTLGLVGESGCGKSSLARAVLQLPPPTTGSVRFEGVELVGLPAGRLRRIRPRLAAVLQDPSAAFDPRMTIGQCLAEPFRVQRRPVEQSRIAETVEQVGLRAGLLGRYPHELSGGQRQRIAIARALVLQPRLLVLDEALASVDVSVQAGLIRLVRGLRSQHGLAQLFIGHDLGVVRQVADRVAVMFAGRIVELADTGVVLERPGHPYTRELVAAAPDLGAGRRAAPAGKDRAGDWPVGAATRSGGCRYRLRCPLASARCEAEDPPLQEVRPGQQVACHNWQE